MDGYPSLSTIIVLVSVEFSIPAVSRSEKPPLKSLSEPYVNLLAHTAPIIQPLAISQISSTQTTSWHALLSYQANVLPFVSRLVLLILPPNPFYQTVFS